MFALLALLFQACSSPTPAPVAPVADPEPEPVVVPAPAPVVASEVTFEYSPLDLDKCETLQLDEEEGWVTLKCAGLGTLPVFVSAGDLRYDTDFGVANEVWQTRPGFNELGTTVEWRLRDGVPFAAILRYIEEGPDGQKAEFLGVFKVGTEAASGCLLDWVPSSAEPSQNEAARALADESAAGFVCAAG